MKKSLFRLSCCDEPKICKWIFLRSQLSRKVYVRTIGRRVHLPCDTANQLCQNVLLEKETYNLTFLFTKKKSLNFWINIDLDCFQTIIFEELKNLEGLRKIELICLSLSFSLSKMAGPIPKESLGQADSKNRFALRIPVNSDQEIRKICFCRLS